MNVRKRKGLIGSFVVGVVFCFMLASCSASNMDDAKVANSNQEQVETSAADDMASLDRFAVSSEASTGGGSSSDMEESLAEAPAVEQVSQRDVVTAGSAGVAPPSYDLTSAVSRKLIYQANLSMEVEQLGVATTELRNAINQSGGYILQFSNQQSNGEIGANYTIKVPADGFMSFVDRLAKMKHVQLEQSMKGSDVTEEYVDLESRLKAKQVVETRLLGFMDKAQKADDLVKFSQQLSAVQEEIELIKGKMRYLDNNVAFSTVELRIYELSDDSVMNKQHDPSLGKRLWNALSTSGNVLLKSFELLLIIIAGALPVLILTAIVIVPVLWNLKKRRKAKPSVLEETKNGHSSTPDDNL